MSGRTTGLVFSKEAADKLIATYNTPDLVRQRDATLQRLNLRPVEHGAHGADHDSHHAAFWPIAADVEARISAALKAGESIRKVADKFGVNASTVQRVKHPFVSAA
jgi:Homeodomain-like domain